jgi:hypothetical protein
MTAHFSSLILLLAFQATAASAQLADSAGDLRQNLVATRLADGGFIVNASATPLTSAGKGLFAAADLESLVKETTSADRLPRYETGEALDGAFTITVGRDDGKLVQYDNVEDVTVFAKPRSLRADGGLTTLVGAVVFTMKPNFDADTMAHKRLEHGVIMLTRLDSSL